MTNFEKTVTPDFFAETLGNLVENFLYDCGDCPFSDFCESLPGSISLSCTNIFKEWAKAKVQILDEVEKKYLKNFLAPWLKRKDTNITITKRKYCHKDKWWLDIVIETPSEKETITLPNFHSKKMYAGMEIGKSYTVEELDLK